MKTTLEARHVEKDEIVGEIDRLLGLTTQADDKRTVFKISDLAKEFGVTLRTLRFYEDRGLLTPERRGTTRLYSRRDRMRLRLVQMAKTLGFSLTEAKQMIDIYDQPNGRHRQLVMAQDRLAEQRKVLLVQEEEIARALKAIDVSIALVSRELARSQTRD